MILLYTRYVTIYPHLRRPLNQQSLILVSPVHEIIHKWLEKNYRSHLRPQGKTLSLHKAVPSTTTPTVAMYDKHPYTEMSLSYTHGHTKHRKTHRRETVLWTIVKTGGLVRKLSKWGNEKIEREENAGLIGKSWSSAPIAKFLHTPLLLLLYFKRTECLSFYIERRSEASPRS